LIFFKSLCLYRLCGKFLMVKMDPKG
jgi:hypothetical protein